MMSHLSPSNGKEPVASSTRIVAERVLREPAQSLTLLSSVYDPIGSRAEVIRLVSHLLSVIGLSPCIGTNREDIRERRLPGSTFGWLVTIVMEPHVGVLLDLFFRGRKPRRLAARK
jgi:hypothetical protein